MQSFHHLTPEVDCFVRQWGGGVKDIFSRMLVRTQSTFDANHQWVLSSSKQLKAQTPKAFCFQKVSERNGENGAGKKIWDWCISLTRTREELCANAREVIHEGSLI